MADYDSGEITQRERSAAGKQKDISKFNQNTLKDAADYNSSTARNIANWNVGRQNDLSGTNADRTTEIAEYNARAAKEQLDRQLANYDMANRQNEAMRDTQFKQASRKSEAERFEAQRNLQNATLGLLGSMNQAMNGSATGNLMHMLRNRNDADNSTYWQTLQDNRNAIQNAYDESYNQNQIAKRDAAINAIKALQDIEAGLSSDLNNINNDWRASLVSTRGDLLTTLGNIEADYRTNANNMRADLAANMNNINPNLYEAPERLAFGSNGYQVPKAWETIEDWYYRKPGSNGKISGYRTQAGDQLGRIAQHNPTLLDYVMPANAEQNVRGYRNRMRGNDYFGQLMNGFNF